MPCPTRPTGPGPTDPRALDAAEVRARLTPELATRVLREVVVGAAAGEVSTPPRSVLELGDRRLTISAGAGRGWFGHRCYVAPGSGAGELVVVHDADGKLVGSSTAPDLAPRRSGAMGALALAALGPRRPHAVALVGAGRQAWHQLWALPERYRDLPIRVVSRGGAEHGSAVELASRAGSELGLAVEPVASVVEALAGADVVIVATSSATPVLTVADLAATRGGFGPDAEVYLASVGPTQEHRHELGTDVLAAAALVVTDSPAQIEAYAPPHLWSGRASGEAARHLGEFLAGAPQVPGPRVFLNTGLAGTEVALLRALLTEG